MKKAGKIWGIGVGPGDPELLTLKAYRIIQNADVVAYPAPDDGDSLARSIAASHLPGGQEEIVIRISMDPAMFPPTDVYDRAHRDISERVEAGRSVAVLCEGDPFFYGSFMYLFEKLAQVWPVEVVPGVSSLTACAAALQMPLASRNDVVTVIPATLDEDAMAERLAVADMAVFIKVGRHLNKVRSVLCDADLIGAARYIERATMANEKQMPVGELTQDSAPYFSMILVRRRGGVR
jgi:precorrin-2/cobalt-factor-2 C20-methyltransferase